MKYLKVRTVINIVAAEFDLDRHVLLSPRRDKRVVIPRWMMFKLCDRFTVHTSQSLAEALDFDRSTIDNGLRRITGIVNTFPKWGIGWLNCYNQCKEISNEDRQEPE